MKKGFVFILAMITLLLSGCVESTPYKGVTNINQLVDRIDINEYFIRDNQYWRVCWDIEDLVWDQEEGYQVTEYPNLPVTNVNDRYDYKHQIYQKDDGTYEMKVDLTCNFDTTVMLNAFSYVTETLTYDGGDIYFHMDITEEDGHYRLNSMKAYKQVFE